MKRLVCLIIIIGSFACTESKEGRKETLKPDYAIKEGASFSITLSSNPSTGYSWQWANKKSITIIDTSKWEYLATNNELIGSGGQEVWTFKGVKTGVDSIILKYARPWDTLSTVETKKIMVQVH